MNLIYNKDLKFRKMAGPVAAIIAVLVLFPILAVEGGMMGKWKVAMSLPRLHKAEALWFKGHKGLVFGHYRSLDDLLNKDIVAGMEKKKAFVLKTVNNGKSWKKTFDGDGELYFVSSREDGVYLYALGRKYQMRGAWQAFLLQSTSSGDSWSELSLPEDSIIGIDFSYKNVGYAWTENKLFITDDGAKSWSEIKCPLSVTLNGPRPIADLNGAIWTILDDKLYKISSNDEITEINLSIALKVDRIDIADDNSLWLAGRVKQGNTMQAKIYRYNEKERAFEEIVEFNNILPKALYAGKKKIFLIGSDMNEVPPRKLLMHSKNMGNSWKKEELAISDAMGPVFFEDEKTIWVYGSADRIQRRNF